MKRQELQVAALENGTVIDHIPSAKIFEVINLLNKGYAIRDVAKLTGKGISTVQRIKKEFIA